MALRRAARRVTEEVSERSGRGDPGDRRGGPPVGRADDVLAALADPTRRRLLDALAARGEATATTLAATLPVSRQAVVKHLAVLGRAGLVRGARRGREVRYAVRPERLDATASWLAGLAAEWDARLAAIKRVAEEAGDPPR
jgi:DNA-binding transcriptional ArsR family regulator